jgi:hypothetical protein
MATNLWEKMATPTTCLSNLGGKFGIFTLEGANVMNLTHNVSCGLPCLFSLAVFVSTSILVTLVYLLMTLVPLIYDSFGLLMTPSSFV